MSNSAIDAFYRYGQILAALCNRPDLFIQREYSNENSLSLEMRHELTELRMTIVGELEQKAELNAELKDEIKVLRETLAETKGKLSDATAELSGIRARELVKGKKKGK